MSARLAVGVKAKILSGTSWVMFPATGVTPGPVNLKVAALIVAGRIACGKVATTTAFEHIPVDPPGGLTELGGDGGRHSVAAVVKVHTKPLAREMPCRFETPVVIVAV